MKEREENREKSRWISERGRQWVYREKRVPAAYSLHAGDPEELWRERLPSLQASPQPPHFPRWRLTVGLLTSLIMSVLATDGGQNENTNIHRNQTE